MTDFDINNRIDVRKNGKEALEAIKEAYHSG